MRLLHVSADYPDPLAPDKTHAIVNLLLLADAHEQRVLSLNRVHWRNGIDALDFGDAAGPAHRAVAYGAPPKGFFLERYLDRLAAWAIGDTERAGYAPDLVHAHKLSIEGLVGERLAAHFGVPLLVSIQGNSDLKILGAKRDLRRRYARIWHEAAVVLPFAPWAEDGVADLLGRRQGPCVLLPCPGPADDVLAPKPTPPVIRTAFNITFWRNKNADGLVRAVGLAAASVPEIELEIIGGGDADAFARLSRLARRAAPGRVHFRGAVPNRDVQGLFNRACAFALVSHRESFGMAAAEALLAGTPCLIARGRGLDGYLPDGAAWLTVDPGSDVDIAEKLVRMVHEQTAFKERLRELGRSGALDCFRRTAIAARYHKALEVALETP